MQECAYSWGMKARACLVKVQFQCMYYQVDITKQTGECLWHFHVVRATRRRPGYGVWWATSGPTRELLRFPSNKLLNSYNPIMPHHFAVYLLSLHQAFAISGMVEITILVIQNILSKRASDQSVTSNRMASILIDSQLLSVCKKVSWRWICNVIIILTPISSRTSVQFG